MLLKSLPALCAALLLAACDTTGGASGDKSAAQEPQMAENAPNGSLIPGPVDGIDQNIGNTVYFDTDSYSLSAAAQTQLQKEAGWLKQYRDHTVTIEGHADERGTREYNLALGERRAQTMLNYLSALGVDTARLKEISYGKERPICVDSTEACWSQNRRGVTTVDN